MFMASLDTAYLVGIMHEADNAGHGKKGDVYKRACAFLGVSLQTLHRELSMIRVNSRKRRADAGNHQLSLAEAHIISAYLMEGYRQNNKKMVAIGEAVASLRANGLILAANVDTDTGELTELSDSAVARALRSYNLHPEQLRRPAPHVNLRSKHPNHVWQIDASVCTLYYLPTGESLIETNQAVHYKNKPGNLEKISQQRVIRYVGTDHCSGVIRWRYFPHSESGEHTVQFIAWMIKPKAALTLDPFYGVPFIIQVDPGATSAGLVQRFCDRLGIELHVNKPGAPRSKGQVENGNNLVEVNFEQGLRFCGHKIKSIADLNRHADVYQRYFNATRKHTRTGMTRTEGWLHIKPHELRTVNEAVDLLALATSKPESRKVSGDLTISYKGKWKVGKLPFVQVGDDVLVCDNPLNGMVMAVIMGDDDRETYVELEQVTINEWGFNADGPVIGNNYASHADTVADTNRKLVAQIATGTTNLDDAKKVRSRKGYAPFEGKIDPFKVANETEIQTVLPKRGTDAGLESPTRELHRMNRVQMAKWLAGRLRDDYDPAMLPDLAKRFPDGATEPELEQVLADLAAGRSAAGRAKLQAV
ncbi:hypothetical protein NP603_13885 [Methylomonas sp. SURF-1]|uniref:Integrase catalytic domain-containing protein n=1 Tax=Methylomonas aurea TaxID=2952224 RepID=A0ABT1UK32_9GAMM|nr:hypothetical protein [Methylomonas sp. SURF-1]MCQ8182208.1 hypothetical protein [Methylomonas sp. SURF-1]